MSKRMVLVLLALGLGLSTTALAAPKGAVLEAQGVALNAAGKTHEAGDAYEAAARLMPPKEIKARRRRPMARPQNSLKKKPLPCSKSLTPKVAKPAVACHPALPATTAAPATKSVTLPPLVPKAGHIVGRVINEMGGAVPNFTIKYSGFEDGKPIYNHMENVGAEVKCGGGAYATKVRPDWRLPRFGLCDLRLSWPHLQL